MGSQGEKKREGEEEREEGGGREKMERGGGGRTLPVSDCQQLSTALYPSGGGLDSRRGGCGSPQTIRSLAQLAPKQGQLGETQKGMTFVLAGQALSYLPF